MSNSADKALVRDLARQVRDFALSDECEIRRKRWRDVNALRKPDRAPVWCRPAGAWKEILPQESLKCTDPLCRSVEAVLRRDLFKIDVADDHIAEPWWGVRAAFDRDTEHTWGMPVQQLVDRTSLGGWRYDPPVKCVEDYDRIQIPTFTFNPAKTDAALERMGDLLGDAMPVQVTCGAPLGAGLGTYVDQLRGMAGMLEDLAFAPAAVHRVMAKLLEGVLRAMRAAEDSGRLAPNNFGGMMCSDPIGESPDGVTRLRNLWCCANSQEFQEVSPPMWQEFLLNYQMPIFQQFGLVQYGCCEDLTQKIDRVLRIPNLRVFVSSFWTDIEKVAEACGADYTIMWRELSAHVTVNADFDRVRQHLQQGMHKLRGCRYQVVMREIETLGGDPKCLHKWAQIGKQVAEENA